MQNFNSLAFTQTDLDKFLTIFQVNFRTFLRKFQNFPILKKKFEHRKKIKRHLLPKFKLSSILTNISKVIKIFLTPEFALEISKFQNSEYEVHQPSPTD
jgi:hypothetical protein